MLTLQTQLFGLPEMVARRRRGDAIKEPPGSDAGTRSDRQATTGIPAAAISGTEAAKLQNSEQDKATNQHRGPLEPQRSTISYQQAKWLGWTIEAREGLQMAVLRPKRNWYNFETH